MAFTKLPAGAEVRFFGLDSSPQVFGPITTDQIRALTIPAQAGEPGVFWSPVVTGETVGMEIYVPNRRARRKCRSRSRACRTSMRLLPRRRSGATMTRAGQSNPRCPSTRERGQVMVRRIRQSLRLVAVLALGLTAASGQRSVATAAQPAAGQDAVVTVQSEEYPPSIKAALDNREPPALKRVYSRDTIPNSVTLTAVTGAPPLPASDSLKGRLQVGFSRDIPVERCRMAETGRPHLGRRRWRQRHGRQRRVPARSACALLWRSDRSRVGTEVRFSGRAPIRRCSGP